LKFLHTTTDNQPNKLYNTNHKQQVISVFAGSLA
jgi:hypothetical protein